MLGKLSGHVYGAVTLFNCFPIRTTNDFGPGTGWQQVHTDTAVIGPGYSDDQSPNDLDARELTTSIWPMAQIIQPDTVKERWEETRLEISIESYTIDIPSCEKEGKLFTVTLNRDAGISWNAIEGKTTLRERCGVTITPDSGRETLGFLRGVAYDLQLLITMLVNQSTTIEEITFLHPETPEEIGYKTFELYAHWRGEKTDQDNMLRPTCYLEDVNKHIIRNWFREREKYGPSAGLLCHQHIMGNYNQPADTAFHEAFVAVERIWSTWNGKKQSVMRDPSNILDLAKYTGEPFASRIDQETAKRMIGARNQHTAHSDPHPAWEITGREWLKNAELLRYLGKAFLMKEIEIPAEEITQHCNDAMAFSR